MHDRDSRAGGIRSLGGRARGPDGGGIRASKRVRELVAKGSAPSAAESEIMTAEGLEHEQRTIDAENESAFGRQCGVSRCRQRKWDFRAQSVARMLRAGGGVRGGIGMLSMVSKPQCCEARVLTQNERGGAWH
jgi:hypothetical protein